jgi:two-component system, OmpR family, phosphate regulon response regulator PhoB
MKELALIVEDDFDIGIIFAEALKMSGFDTEIITDGQAALDRLQEIRPDVVVLDLHLPNVSGAEILRYIRQTEHLKNMRVVVATADPRMADSIRQEATLVLDKPVSFQQLKLLTTRLHP